MEVNKSIEQKYQEKFGITETVRNERLTKMQRSLESALQLGGFNIVDQYTDVNEASVYVNGRVKELGRLEAKMKRVDYEFDDAYDVWGLEVIVDGNEAEEKALGIIAEDFLSRPSSDDLRRSDGEQVPPVIESGPKTANAAHKDFRAISVFRKSNYGIVTTRILQKDLYERMQDEDSPLHHDNYQKRQSELSK